MKNLSLFIVIFILSGISAFAQNEIDPNQKLADMLPTKKWFEIERFYQTNKEKINNEFVNLWYKAETAKVFNRYAESIDAYEQLIDKNPLGMELPALIGFCLQSLLNVCAEAQEYDKGQQICQKMIAMLEADTTIESSIRQSNMDGFQEVIQGFESFKTSYLPTQIIDTNPESDGPVKLIKCGNAKTDLTFMATWNQVPLRTIFDTGAGACYIWNREIAERIGVRFMSKDTIMMNGNTIKGMMGMIDSLEFGKFKIKNVPVYVSIENIDRNDPRQVKCDSVLNSHFDIVFGLSIIKQLHVVEFDFTSNTMSFPKKVNIVEKFKNMFIENNGTIRLLSKVADNDFLALFDTGCGLGININFDFYEKNRERIPIVKSKEKSNQYGMVGGCNAASISKREIYDCMKIDLQINEVNLHLKNDCEVSPNTENDYQYGAPDGGSMGTGIFKYCRKAVFDFNNMVFEVEK